MNTQDSDASDYMRPGVILTRHSPFTVVRIKDGQQKVETYGAMLPFIARLNSLGAEAVGFYRNFIGDIHVVYGDILKNQLNA